jgi:hypothetical protein
MLSVMLPRHDSSRQEGWVLNAAEYPLPEAPARGLRPPARGAGGHPGAS